VLGTYQRQLVENGHVLIPKIEIEIDGHIRVYSLLSTLTEDDSFSYLKGIQGQFVDRTDEFKLRREREELLEQKIKDRSVIEQKTSELERIEFLLRSVIEQKTSELERIANRLAKYLAPQIYKSIFESGTDPETSFKRKN